VNRIGQLAGLVMLVSLFAGTACGYRLAGTSSVLPEHVKILAVVSFSNNTDRPEIEQRVTEAVARELSRRGRYEVVTDPLKADAVLHGTVTSYRTRPVEFTTEGREARTEATLTIQATLRDTQSDEILWSQSGLIFMEQFDVTEEAGSEGFIFLESLTLDRLASGVASVLATSMLEGF
jgi:outer membrane lipopolysaccharide assembly protein LptE/RlpB